MLRFTRWLLILSLVCAARAGAQEVQVPLDESGQVQTVDRPLAGRLGLWLDEYPDFHEARLFQAPDASFVLEITLRREGRLLRERLPRSAAEVAELRRRVQAAARDRAAMDAPGALNQEGRYLLLGQTTLAGIGFYGWAVPVSLDVDDAGGAAGLSLLTAGASFFLPFALTANRPVTYGMANLSRYGVTRGILHGGLLHDLVQREERSRFSECIPDGPCIIEEDDFDRARMAAAVVASAAEGVGGYLWARNEEMSAGTANALVGGGDAGLLWGLGAARVLGVDHRPRLRAALGLGGAAAGIGGARWLARRRDYTWGDADLLYTAGWVGAYGGLATAQLFGVEETDPQTGLAMLGSAAGLFVADRAVASTDFSVGQATLNRLGTVAGALVGASVGVMADDEMLGIAGAALGAIGGYAFTFAALAPDAPSGRGERMSSSDWEMTIQPQGLLSRAAAGGLGTAPAPLLSVRYRF